MPLPIESRPFPAAEWAPVFDRYRANAAWWSDDIDPVAAIYGGQPGGGRGDNEATHYNKGDGTWRAGGVKGLLNTWFNGRVVAGTTASPGALGDVVETRLHIPAAGNIASLSAAALMQSPPTVRLMVDGKAVDGPRGQAVDRIFQSDAHRLELHDAAEMVAGLGAVALTAHWDPAQSDAPWVEHTACDAVIPEWNGRFLVAVNLWTAHAQPGAVGGLADAIYYHIERHEPGRIVHALYKGSSLNIGVRVPFDSPGAPEAVQYLVGIRDTVYDRREGTLSFPTGIDQLTARWWRNRATKRFRDQGMFSKLGRADIEGAEQILDAIDRNWSSWMRDVNVGKAQMIVPRAFTESMGEGKGLSYNSAAEYLVPMDFTTLNAGDGDKSILVNQFKIRYEEHAATNLGLIRELVNHAGWSVAGYGYGPESGGRSVTATEVNATEGNSAATLDVKQLEFKAAMSGLAPALIALGARHYSMPVQGDAEIAVEFEDTSDVDPLVSAQIALADRTAQRASIKTLVTERNGDWTTDQIDIEVATIYLEQGIGVEADPAGQFDAQGNPIEEREPIEEPPVDPEADPTEEETP